MHRCPYCDQALLTDADECERCGCDLTAPMIGEDEYRASLRDGSCVVCGRTRSRWSRFTWVTCEKCEAQYCKGCCPTATQVWHRDEFSVSWNCRHCGRRHEKMVNPSSFPA